MVVSNITHALVFSALQGALCKEVICQSELLADPFVVT